jgi:hypothetical protein
MRGRIGGRIGVAYPPSSYGAGGVWRLADVYAAKSGAFGSDPYSGALPWPANTLTIAWPVWGNWWNQTTIDFADATATGSATFSVNVTTTFANFVFSYYWQRSTDAGATWSTVSGSSGSETASDNGYGGGGVAVTLTRTGQAVTNDGELYRLVAMNGLKTVTGPNGTLQFDDNVTVSITDHPQSITRGIGAWAQFASVGSASGQKYGRTYDGVRQWQRSTDSGATWSDFMGGTYALEFVAAAADNGNQYRLKFTCAGQTVFSNAATLTVT